MARQFSTAARFLAAGGLSTGELDAALDAMDWTSAADARLSDADKATIVSLTAMLRLTALYALTVSREASHAPCTLYGLDCRGWPANPAGRSRVYFAILPTPPGRSPRLFHLATDPILIPCG